VGKDCLPLHNYETTHTHEETHPGTSTFILKRSAFLLSLLYNREWGFPRKTHWKTLLLFWESAAWTRSSTLSDQNWDKAPLSLWKRAILFCRMFHWDLKQENGEIRIGHKLRLIGSREWCIMNSMKNIKGSGETYSRWSEDGWTETWLWGSSLMKCPIF